MIRFPDLPPRNQNVFEVARANLGLYLGISPTNIPDAALADCLNCRLLNGKITNENVGYEPLFLTPLDGHVLLIDAFLQSNGASVTIFGTATDLYQYDPGTNEPLYLTPRYSTGTVGFTDASTLVIGTGTGWTAATVKAGDFIHRGTVDQDDPGEDWFEIASVDIGAQEITLVDPFSGTFPGQVYTIRHTFTATDADHWDTDVFPDAPLGTTSGLAAGDHWFATNNSELVVWDGIASEVVVLSTDSSGLGFSCKALLYYKNMMLYGNLVESGAFKPGNFKNSAIADPENVTTLEANEYTMVDGIDSIEAMVRLGDSVVGYGSNSISVAQFVSLPVFFAIRTVAPGIGIYSSRMVMDFGDYHEFLSTDQAYRFDGVQLQPFGGHVFSDILQRADRSRATKSHVSISEENLEVYWVIALSSDGASTNQNAQIAYSEHYAEDVGRAPTPFMARQLPATATGVFVSSNVGRFSDFPGQGFHEVPFSMNNSFLTAEFPIVLMGTASGRIWKMNTLSRISLPGADDTYDSFIRTPTRALVDGNHIGAIRAVEPYVEKNAASGILTIEVLTQERMGGDESQPSPAQEFQVDHSGPRFASFRAAGRYGSVRMSSSDLDVPWRLSGYRVKTERLGER